MKHLRPAQMEDVEYVAKHMRQADIDEVGALGFSPLDALEKSYVLSLINFTLLSPVDQCPIAVCGVGASPLHPEWGAVWLLGTDGIQDNRMTFLRHSKAALDLLFEASGRKLLYNYTHHKNALHHDWLRWLGFSFIRKVSLPPHGDNFIEFAKIRN